MVNEDGRVERAVAPVTAAARYEKASINRARVETSKTHTDAHSPSVQTALSVCQTMARKAAHLPVCLMSAPECGGGVNLMGLRQ